MFVWYGGNGGLGANGNPLNADWYREGNINNLFLGRSVSKAGDVKKTGYSGLISGAMNNVYAWYGSASGLPVSGHDFEVSSTVNFGGSGYTAGDVKGDGYADVLIGASLVINPPYTQGGAIYGFYGSSAGFNISSTWCDIGGRD